MQLYHIFLVYSSKWDTKTYQLIISARTMQCKHVKSNEKTGLRRKSIKRFEDKDADKRGREWDRSLLMPQFQACGFCSKWGLTILKAISEQEYEAFHHTLKMLVAQDAFSRGGNWHLCYVSWQFDLKLKRTPINTLPKLLQKKYPMHIGSEYLLNLHLYSTFYQ